jgi:uncharacterized protein YggE
MALFQRLLVVRDAGKKSQSQSGGETMSSKLWSVLFLPVVALTLAACGQVGALPTLAAEEAAPARGGGGGISPTDQFTEGLVVVGTGTASAEPEAARITFGVELRGEAPAALVDEGAEKLDRAVSAARELEVADEDIQTTGYSLWVENVYDPERGVPTGEVIYHLSHHVQVTLRDLDQVGELLAAVVEAGANSVSEVSFTVEDPDVLVRQARQQALEDAAARAQQMAEGLNITLGKPIMVMETSSGYPVPMERGVGGGGGVTEAAVPSISPGAFSVSVNVQIVYEIR